MRQMRLKPMPGTRPLAGSVLAIALSLLAGLSQPARAEDASSGKTCAERYHASLGRIAGAEYQALKAARRGEGAAGTADASLPGNLLFPPISAGERTREETAALRFAASLARAKGRTIGGSDADAAWMADRLRTALGDYLTQAPSPYLCSGVPEYVAELRGDARRLGPPPIQREALVAAQTAVVERAVKTAFDAMKPVPKPSDKPTDHPDGSAADALRPTAGLDRVDTTISTGSTRAASADDPDLPPLKPEAPTPYATSADLVAVVDRLAETAKAGGFFDAATAPRPFATEQSPTPQPMAPAIPAATYPVLARLAEVRPIVTGVRPAVSDRTVRLRLATALSAIEALDYLMRARVETPDPLATAIDTTFEAILKAHGEDCTCRN